MEHTYLKVSVGAGLFFTEYEVKVTDNDGKEMTFCIDRAQVKEKGQDRYIEINSSSKDTNGYKNVLLPTETLETFSRWIKIPSNRVCEAI